MSAPTFARRCIVCGHDMELVRRYRDGNELVSCQPCGRREEISQTGNQVPGRPPAELRTTDPRSPAEREQDAAAADWNDQVRDMRTCM